VEVFDGGSVVDPVVVSNVFWASLKAKLLGVVLGQFLAALVFGLIVAFGASQVTNVTDFLAAKLFRDDPSDSTSSSTFRKLPKRKETSVEIRQEDVVRLLVSVLVDVIGTSSEVVPIVGEVSDIAWAPVAGFILRSLYGSNVVLVLEVVEEILPFTDFLPLATICWVVDTFFATSDVARVLQIGEYRNMRRDSERGVVSNPRINGETSSKTNVVDVEARSSEEESNRLEASTNQQDPGDTLTK
jgi:hypothetical protein